MKSELLALQHSHLILKRLSIGLLFFFPEMASAKNTQLFSELNWVEKSTAYMSDVLCLALFDSVVFMWFDPVK